MDHPAPLRKDVAMRATNRAENERQRKEKEDKKRKQQQRQWALDWGKDIDDEDEEEEEEGEVVDEGEGIPWDRLADKDVDSPS
jgi:hypothetical protein